jgi:hypothetical protein
MMLTFGRSITMLYQDSEFILEGGFRSSKSGHEPWNEEDTLLFGRVGGKRGDLSHLGCCRALKSCSLDIPILHMRKCNALLRLQLPGRSRPGRHRACRNLANAMWVGGEQKRTRLPQPFI